MSTKVMTIVGTRPEIIKMSLLIAALDKYTDQVLVHSGQNYSDSLSSIFLQELKFRPFDYWFGIGEGARSPAAAVAQVIDKTDALLDKERPDAFVVYGDTNTCLAAYAAKRRKIPIFHLEAGNRCFDQRVPEEVNRKIIDHLSDVNMCLTEHARRNLIVEGLPQDRTFVVGSPMPEIISHHKLEVADRKLPMGLAWHKYFLVSFHREENVDDDLQLSRILRGLGELAGAYPDDRIIVSTHPRTKARLDAKKVSGSSRIEFCEPFGWIDWCRLQQDARCVLSDSGSLTEEACYLGFPAVMIRDQHERPEGQDAGAIIMAGLNPDRLVEAVHVACNVPHPPFAAVAYGNHQFSTAALRIILGYTDYVNRVVWRKS